MLVTVNTVDGPTATVQGGVEYNVSVSVAGTQGSPGADGSKGDPGVGVPSGGGVGQVLTKASAADHDTTWDDPSGGGGVLSAVYESGPQAIVTAGQLTLAHGLGAIPKLVQAYLVCTTAEGNYSVGDVLLIENVANPGNTSGTRESGVSVVMDDSNITVRFADGFWVFKVIDKATGLYEAINNGSWEFHIRAMA